MACGAFRLVNGRSIVGCPRQARDQDEKCYSDSQDQQGELRNLHNCFPLGFNFSRGVAKNVTRKTSRQEGCGKSPQPFVWLIQYSALAQTNAVIGVTPCRDPERLKSLEFLYL
jgi:hypothetical protein